MTLYLRIFGSGPSSGVPSLRCKLSGGCCVCNKVTRTNVSILITKTNKFQDTTRVLIDCGKHFYTQFNSYLESLNIGNDYRKNNVISDREKEKIKNINSSDENNESYNTTDSYYTENIDYAEYYEKHCDLIPHLILTHPHADAIGGIDTYLMMCNKDVSLYCNQDTHDMLKFSLPYYFRAPLLTGIRGYFSQKKTVIIEDNYTFEIETIKFTSFEVEHGDCKSMAFLIENQILYVSDCSMLTHQQIEHFSVMKLEYLFIDCLTISSMRHGHLNLRLVKEYASRIKPKRVVLIGCSHEIPNVKSIEDFEVAYDGMEFIIDN